MDGQARANKPLTPVMRQYQAAKNEHPDAIVLFRMGDFYEMFHDDAVVAARALDLTLTSRNKGAEDEIPMAGVPHHAAAGYIAKLVALGHKVAICEQLAEPSKTRGIVPRGVVRVITPGLVTDEGQLDGAANHFLCAVTREEGGHGGAVGLALLDLSTAELGAAVLDGAASLFGELARLDPKEVLVAPDNEELAALCRQAVPRAVVRDDGVLETAKAEEILAATLGEDQARSDAGTLPRLALTAAARLLRFARVCNPGVDLAVRRIAAWDPGDTLKLDEVAQAHLELVRAADGGRAHTLLSTIDETRTPPGARLLRRWLLAPLLDVGAIRRRQDAVEAFVRNPLARTDLRARLGEVGDIERLAVRAVLGQAQPKDLGALRDGLLAAPSVIEALRSIPDAGARQAIGIARPGDVDDVDLPPLDLLEKLADHLRAALSDRPPPLVRDGGIFREGFDKELDEYRALKGQGTVLIAELETKLRQASAIATLKVRFTRVFGWYIEVTRTHAAKVPSSFRRKQTVAGAERYTNDELDELADRIVHAEERYTHREAALFTELVAEVAAHGERLRALAARISQWDVYASLAEVAHRRDYVRPEVDAGTVLSIEDGRHPVVEELSAAGRFVPNDVRLDTEEERLWLVTGPNMAGKSTLMRQVALIVILAQMGSYVPARAARLGIVDRVLSRVGASDNVARGESTFMVEMRETSAILRRATRRSLVILDEIGRGTSTYDGLAIAWAVAEHLHDAVQCRAMFATHYHELTELVATAKHAANYSVSARELGEDVVFLHKLVRGAASQSYGIAVARLAGLPEMVLARAKAILGSLEAGAPLPSGAPASLRRRSGAGKAQLALFGAASGEDPGDELAGAEGPAKPKQRGTGAVSISPSPVLDTLKALEVERLTPLEALMLVAKLKEMSTREPKR